MNVAVNKGTPVTVALAMGVGQRIEHRVSHEHGCFEVQRLRVDVR